jgi:hypothetical protein
MTMTGQTLLRASESTTDMSGSDIKKQGYNNPICLVTSRKVIITAQPDLTPISGGLVSADHG